MTEEVRKALSEIEEELYILAFKTQDQIPEEDIKVIRKTWNYVYALLNDRV